MFRFEEGHEALMRQALKDFSQSGGQLPEEVDPLWLTLGNVRTDIPDIDTDRTVSWWKILTMIWRGTTGINAQHPAHAMRHHLQPVREAYAEMRAIIEHGFELGCDSSATWQTRALAFGSMLHTLQDSYCLAHAERLNAADTTSPLIDMFTYPSRQHPFTTKRDSVWQDTNKTAFKPNAAASIQATVAALHIFTSQSLADVEHFLKTYLSLRPDIKGH